MSQLRACDRRTVTTTRTILIASAANSQPAKANGSVRNSGPIALINPTTTMASNRAAQPSNAPWGRGADKAGKARRTPKPAPTAHRIATNNPSDKPSALSAPPPAGSRINRTGKAVSGKSAVPSTNSRIPGAGSWPIMIAKFGAPVSDGAASIRHTAKAIGQCSAPNAPSTPTTTKGRHVCSKPMRIRAGRKSSRCPSA